MELLLESKQTLECRSTFTTPSKGSQSVIFSVSLANDYMHLTQLVFWFSIQKVLWAISSPQQNNRKFFHHHTAIFSLRYRFRDFYAKLNKMRLMKRMVIKK